MHVIDVGKDKNNNPQATGSLSPPSAEEKKPEQIEGGMGRAMHGVLPSVAVLLFGPPVGPRKTLGGWRCSVRSKL